METTCQDSYPLNSENESPFGIFRVYLSCAELVSLPMKARVHAMIGIVSILWLVIVHTSLIKFSGPSIHRPPPKIGTRIGRDLRNSASRRMSLLILGMVRGKA